MHVDDLLLVSVDDHVVEPPGFLEPHLPTRYRDAAPQVEHQPDGTDFWVYEGRRLPNVGLNAVVGRPRDEYGIEPTSFADMRPGCYDIHDRVKDMDANGVVGSLNFPSVAQFCGQLFAKGDDKDQALAMVRAYNDWHLQSWCGAYPDRFIPCSIPVLWEPELAAAEVRRMAGAGCRAVSFSENPERLGYPSLHNDHWDPFWGACEDTGTVVCLHIGSSSQLAITAADAPIDVLITLQPVNIVQAAADLIWSRVLKEFPTIKFALVEGGTGWIPYFLSRIDYTYEHHRLWTGQDFGDRLPSQVFKERFVTCFIDDPVGIQLREQVGLDNMTWECDYPHSDCTWPESPERLMKSLDGVPDSDIDKITHGNAMRIFGYDPISLRGLERCSVGGLRREAAAHGVDTSIRARGKAHDQRGTTGTDLARGPRRQPPGQHAAAGTGA